MYTKANDLFIYQNIVDDFDKLKGTMFCRNICKQSVCFKNISISIKCRVLNEA